MACENHVEPLKDCLSCQHELVKDQQTMIWQYSERFDCLYDSRPDLREVLMNLCQRYPLIVRTT